MNQEAPCQNQGTKLWAYTTVDDQSARAYPIGYCSPWWEYTEAQIQAVFGGDREHYEEYARPYRKAALAGKYHEGGHTTPEEACTCYKAYRLDFDLRFVPADDANARRIDRCVICKTFTSGYAQVDGEYAKRWTLCGEHQTREVVESLFRVGESWHS